MGRSLTEFIDPQLLEDYKNVRTRNYEYYVCDFETTVFKDQTYTEVWAAAMVKLGTEDVKSITPLESSWTEYLT